MPYSDLSPEQKAELREYVEGAHERFSTIRNSKENMAFAGVGVFIAAAATVLGSKDWPPGFAAGRPLLIVIGFSILWLMVAVYLRYQLRRRRWAALRVAGCDWLLAEWLPESPRAMNGKATQHRPKNPRLWVLLLDLVWPLKAAVVVIDAKYTVYPQEVERAWLLAEERGTDALQHERIIHAAGWLAMLAVALRTLCL